MSKSREHADRQPTDADQEEFIDRYRSYLRIDENELDRDIRRQPELFYEVADALARAVSRRDEAKKGLAELEAALDEGVRRLAKRKKEKITEREIATEIKRQPEFIQAGDDLLRLGRWVGRLGALKEAFEQRRYMLRDMAGTYAAGYWGGSVAGSSSRSVRDREAELAREDQSASRKRWRNRSERV